jgi:hypothetical protein
MAGSIAVSDLGPIGPTGVQGVTGPTGATGETGPSVTIGNVAPVAVSGSTVSLSGGYAKYGSAFPIIYIGTEPGSPSEGDIWISF